MLRGVKRVSSTWTIHTVGVLLCFAVVWSHPICAMGLLPDTYYCGLRMRREGRARYSRHRLQNKPLINDPGISGACATPNFMYHAGGRCSLWFRHWHILTSSLPGQTDHNFNFNFTKIDEYRRHGCGGVGGVRGCRCRGVSVLLTAWGNRTFAHINETTLRLWVIQT